LLINSDDTLLVKFARTGITKVQVAPLSVER
jgi:hypothetical protein